MTEVTSVAVVIVRHGQKVLVRPRPVDDPLLAGLWEFPGGKIGIAESSIDAARRELREETGLEAALEAFESEDHTYEDRRVAIDFFLGELDAHDRVPPPVRGWHWVGVDELEAPRIPAANRRVVARLREGPTD